MMSLPVGIALRSAGQLEPVHPRQLDVHQDQPRARTVSSTLQAPARRPSRSGRRSPRASAGPAPASGWPGCRRRSGWVRWPSESPVHGGRVALGGGSVALNVLPSLGRLLTADRPALGLDDALGEREAETGARVLLGRARRRAAGTRRTAGARSSARDADAGVLHLDAELRRRPPASPRSAHPPALGRELDRVRQVVVQDLLELGRVEHTPLDDRVDRGSSTLMCFSAASPRRMSRTSRHDRGEIDRARGGTRSCRTRPWPGRARR